MVLVVTTVIFLVLVIFQPPAYGVQLEGSPNLTENLGTRLISHILFDSTLNHLAVDRSTGMVYVGAVNKLYQISSDLNIIAAVKTGPHNDSNECSVLECPSDIVRRPTDNWNKVLLIDPSANNLIVCGSLFQGICHIRSLQNVSVVEHEVQEAVVANAHNCSTVAFIGPGPPVPLENNVLYVGVTFTANSPHRSEIPAVSSRSLARDKLFQIASSAVTTGTRMYVNSFVRESFRINYVYGFSSEGFSYFLTTQYKSSAHNAPKELITKLVRICQRDLNYYSYTEIPVDCISESTKFNIVNAAHLGKPGPDLAENLGITTEDDVLFTVFSESNDSKNANKSALCVYSLKAIRRKFLQNIKSCFNGVGEQGLDYISINMPCVPRKPVTITEDFCGLDVNSPLGGEQAIASIPVLLSELRMTSIAVTTTSNFTVVFIGTLTGQLKKVIVESSQAAQQYALMNVDVGSKIQPDMYLDTVKYDLYLMSKHKLFKIKVYDCSVYTTCGACLSAKDAFCGWCSLENKCSPKSECQDKDPLSWLSYKSGKCATITSVSPSQLQRSTVGKLEVMIENLPNLKEPLVCAFTFTNMETSIITNAAKKSNGVNCTTPRIDLLPQIGHGKNHLNSVLAIKTPQGPDLVSTKFTFFDCSTFLTCTECVSSQFPCDWCFEAMRCTHDTAKSCRNDILVTGISRIGPSYRSGPGFCPAINVTDEGQEIMVAYGTKKQIKVKEQIISQFIVQTRFVCQFNIEGRVTSVNAQLLGHMIYCDEMEFAYRAKKPNLTATFTVIWGGSKPLDNPNNIRVVIYRCKEMADSCGACSTLDEKYRCGWCSSSNTCEVEHQCGISGKVEGQKNKDWLNSQQTCPNPEIHSFDPKTGPWEGGTNITIRGINLGKKFEDIYGGVTIAGTDCIPFRELYVQTKEIVCKVDGPGVKSHRSGRVVVQISDFRGESTSGFAFVDPEITDFTPKFGPIAGGTIIKIVGKDLNAGSRISAYLDEHPCEILSTDENEATCRTTAVQSTIFGKLRMEFDNGVREFNGDNFEYVSNPSIDYVTSGDPGQTRMARGIPAGGIKIYVVGQNFFSIEKPKIYVYYRDQIFLNDCKSTSNKEMQCLSPEIDLQEVDTFQSDEPLPLEYGFIMDDVKTVKNLSSKLESAFELYPNPVYYPFEENLKHFNGEYLTINGRNLDQASKTSDVTVKLGDNAICNITSLTRHQLTCRPPMNQEIEKVNVKVIVGNGLTYDIGQICFPSASIPSSFANVPIAWMAAMFTIFTLILIGFSIVYCQKTLAIRRRKEEMELWEAGDCNERL